MNNLGTSVDWKLSYFVLKHVKDLLAVLSFSHGNHLMMIFSSSPTFHFCPNVVTSLPFVIFTKLFVLCVPRQIHSGPIQDQISGTSTRVPWLLLFAGWPHHSDHFIPMPLSFGIISRRWLSRADLWHPSRRLSIPTLSNCCLFCLVLSCFCCSPCFILFHFSVCPL